MNTNTATTTHYFLDTLPNFLAYFGTATILGILFLAAYVAITPHREFALIRSGQTAPAISLVGSFLGFVLPVAIVISHSANILDVILWSLAALVVQVVVFFGITRFFSGISNRISENCTASGIFVGGLSLAFGALQAACMVP